MLPGVTTIVFVGAGSAEFTRQLLRDLLTYDDLGDLDLVMHDIDPARLALAEQLAHISLRHHGRTASVRAIADLREALDGADFVINTVNIGGHAATVTDFDVPETFGLRQTIADTLGVGGVFRGLRTFPFLDQLGSAITEVCPDAWLLNYTNPMAMNIGYLAATHPGVKVLGLCHSVYWTLVDLGELVDAPFDRIDFRSAGVNHQAWILDWRLDGENLYDRLDRLIDEDPELRRRVRVDMYRRLGYYPTETSEHSSEYVPWYLHDDAEIERLRLPIRDYVGISAANVEETERLMVEAKAGEYVEPEEDAAEYAPQVIHSMVTGQRREIQANVVNRDLIDNLPAGAPVEVPCVIDGDGARPQAVGDLPSQCAALNRTFLSVVDLTVRAATEHRPEHIRHALMVDPNTSATLDVRDIWRLADAMVAAHEPLLPGELRARLGAP
jgi:alpha-galactosidase